MKRNRILSRISALSLAAVMAVSSPVDSLGAEYSVNEAEVIGEDGAESTDSASDPGAEDSLYTGYREIEFDIEQTSGVSRDASGDSDSVDPDSEDIQIIEDTYGLPSSYTTPLLPDLRDQTPYNNCWAYSSIALAEINLLNNGKARPDINLSELQLSYFTYNFVTDPLGGTEDDDNRSIGSKGPLQVGGNLLFSTNVLAGWIGAADADDVDGRSEISYGGLSGAELNSGISPDEQYAYGADTAHLTGYYIAEYDRDNLDVIKNMVMEYGAASIAMRSAAYTSYYNSTYNSFYYNGSSSNDHAATIVGWNDDFPKEHFKYTPAGDGAWLIRNSWGGRNGKDDDYSGYFWMSYYDSAFRGSSSSKAKVFAMEFDTADNYDHNYQYDGGMYSTSTGFSKAANVFEAHGNSRNSESIEAVSFATMGADAAYRIDIYLGLEDPDDPESGTLRYTTEGLTSYAGYYTIPTESISLSEGELFSVIVTLSGTSKGITSEGKTSSSWYDITVDKKPGQSFVYDGGKWQDWSGIYAKYGNFRIKAFTNNGVGVSFDTNADDGEVSFEGHGINVQTGGIYGELPVPERKGYTFVNWNTSPDGSGEVIVSDTVVSAKSDHTLYAIWEINRYLVEFDSRGGSEVASQTVEYSDRAEEPEEPVSEGHIFGGWYTDTGFGRKYDFDSLITDDIVLYARWGIPVTLDPVGGYFGDSAKKTVIVYNGSTYGVLPVPVRGGYCFAGWYTEDNEMAGSRSIVYRDGPHTLYAKWVEETDDITVDTAVSAVVLDTAACFACIGETVMIRAQLLPVTADPPVVWSTDRAGIIGYEENGDTLIVTPKAEGTVTLTARAGSKKAVCRITVTGSPEDEETPMIVSSSAGSVAVEKTITMKAVYGGLKPANASVNWSVESADGNGQAAITAKGVLRGISEGRVNVYAYNPATGSRSEAYTVDIYVPVKKASLNVATVTLPVDPDADYQLGVNITPAVTGATAATGSEPGRDLADEITWSLKNPQDAAYVYLDPETGRVSGLKATSAGIPVLAAFTPYGAAKAKVLTCRVFVRDIVLNRLTISARSLTVDENHSAKLSISAVPMPANDGISISADNDNILFDYDPAAGICMIRGVKQGSSTLTVTASDGNVIKKASCKVTVSPPPERIDISGGSGISSPVRSYDKEITKDIDGLIPTGKSAVLKAAVYSSSGRKYRTQNVSWSSDDPSVLFFPSAGKIMTLKTGTAVITARSTADPSVYATNRVMVYDPVSSIKLDRTKAVIYSNGSVTDCLDAFRPVCTGSVSDPGKYRITVSASGKGEVGAASVRIDELEAVLSGKARKIYISGLDYSADPEGFAFAGNEILCVRGKRAGSVKLKLTITDMAGRSKKTNITVRII